MLCLNEALDSFSPDDDKRKALLALLKRLIAAKVPVDCVGLQVQAVWHGFDVADLRTFIDDVLALGLVVEISQLDARLRLFSDAKDPYEAQGLYYRDIVESCLSRGGACTGITWSGVSDATSWFDNVLVRPCRPAPPRATNTTARPRASIGSSK